MAKLQISYRNWLTAYDGVTISGGSWLGSAPAANLADRILSRLARSTDASTASTKVLIDLKTARTTQLFGLFGHNATTVGKLRLTAGSSPWASDMYDSGWIDIWTAIYLPEDLEWEDDNWWTGTLSEEDREGYPIQFLHAFTAVKARYWAVEVDDVGNPAGHFDASFGWLGPLWSPLHNYTWNPSLGWEHHDGEVEFSLGGVIYPKRARPANRAWDFVLEDLTDAEAFGQVLEMERLAGHTGYVVVIPDADDAVRRHRRDMLARLRRFDRIKQTYYDRQAFGAELEEIVA